MCKELVSLSTQDLSSGFPVTSSLMIAKKFGKNHNIVLRDIRELEKELKESLETRDIGVYKIVQSSYINNQNKSQDTF